MYGICNILGLSNACINPVLYGYFNENFRKEYKSIYRAIPWNSISSARRISRVFMFELNPLGRGNNRNVEDGGDADSNLVTANNNSSCYAAQGLLGNKHSSQENSTTMSAPAALVNSIGAVTFSSPRRQPTVACQCPRHRSGRGGGGGLKRLWLGSYFSKCKRVAFLRVICKEEDAEEDVEAEEPIRCTVRSSCLRWADDSGGGGGVGVGVGAGGGHRRPAAPPKGHRAEKEWERRKRLRRLERRAASLSSLAHKHNRWAHSPHSRRRHHQHARASNRYVQVRFREEDDDDEEEEEGVGTVRRALSLCHQSGSSSFQPSCRSSCSHSVGSAGGCTNGCAVGARKTSGASLVKVSFGVIPKYSVSLGKKKANGKLKSSSSHDDDDDELGEDSKFLAK